MGMHIPVREASEETVFSQKLTLLRANWHFFVLLFSGILGFDILVDKNGDVQHNLTVMAFDDDDNGKIKE